jgi:hypothetical protein
VLTISPLPIIFLYNGPPLLHLYVYMSCISFVSKVMHVEFTALLLMWAGFHPVGEGAGGKLPP